MTFEDKKKAHREKCLAYYHNNKERSDRDMQRTERKY
jgi:hypothetical protein